MRQTNAMRRNTLIFFALGPVNGGLCMFILLLAELDYPQALSEIFSSGMILMVLLFIIGGYVVGALPAVASGLLFAFVASRRTLNLLQSVLIGAGASFLTSAMAVVVIALINPGAPKWNWIIPGAGVLAGALCGGYCSIVERKHGRPPAKSFHS
ncbi:hypothetical protein [Stenotrophomonas oahuensis]|uniref:Uncharacterized protein n=1 Tax=Stenotrophomonas oahuensis TaxID=3003271 RepID=A0ABY9YSK1_9GAMM|nr:hypothetical protein [Stenotrophomonas sp. A5586]WNH53867.1 hypothetical protein PDM29_06190 [Stenotrophomonas sp. A5586]